MGLDVALSSWGSAGVARGWGSSAWLFTAQTPDQQTKVWAAVGVPGTSTPNTCQDVCLGLPGHWDRIQR